MSSATGAAVRRWGRCPSLIVVILVSAAAAVFLPAGRLLAQDPAGAQTPLAGAPSYPIDPDAVPRPTLQATRTDEPITIDGQLTEASWAHAPVGSGFFQNRPRSGYPATDETEVMVLFDTHNLYVGAILHDAHPDQLITAGLEHDFQPLRGDLFGIVLDPFLDRRSSVIFTTNPGGAVLDYQTFDNGRTSVNAWDGIVEVRTSIQPAAWVVEMRIPLTSVNFNPERDREPWGLNFVRISGRTTEITTWAPIQVRDIAYTMSKAGYLVGLTGLEAGRNLRVKPFAVTNQRTGSLVVEPDRGSDFDGGIDARYGITPRLSLDLTFRTDFSQVEVDQEQVNLTRFSAFFPERREFFLENQGVFAFGDVNQFGVRLGATPQDFTLFHSRRIGLGEDGRPIPLWGGARVTGRVGPVEVGLVDLQSEATTATSAENFSVARVKTQLFGDSDVGVLFAERRETSGDHDLTNRSVGVDANFRLLQHLTIASYLAGTRDSKDGAEGSAGRISVGWRDNFFETTVMLRDIDEGFKPGLGFLRRGGIRHYYGNFGVHPRTRAFGLAELNPYVEVDYFTDPSGLLESRETIAALAFTFVNSATLSLERHDRFERIERSFPIFQNIRVEPGDYRFGETDLIYRSSQSRRLTGHATLKAGDFFGGDLKGLAVGGSWRPRHDFFAILEFERNDVHLPGGTFLADLASLRTQYAWSTRLFGSALVQYNAQTDQLVTNVRVNFKYAPLSDVFLVYQDRHDARTGATLERLLALKATRLFQF